MAEVIRIGADGLGYGAKAFASYDPMKTTEAPSDRSDTEAARLCEVIVKGNLEGIAAGIMNQIGSGASSATVKMEASTDGVRWVPVDLLTGETQPEAMMRCDDGVALNAASHPNGPLASDDADINPDSLEHGEMDSETGMVAWGPDELVPPAGAAVGSLHWVRQVSRTGSADSDVDPVLCPDAVWLWTGNQWRHGGIGGVADFPSCAYGAGWRYLGPAVPSDKVEGMVPWEQMDSWRRRALRLEAQGHPSPSAEQRIAELTRSRDQYKAERDNALDVARHETLRYNEVCRERDEARKNWEWSTERIAELHSYVRTGVTLAPVTDDPGHLIWWPDHLPIPYFNDDDTVSLPSGAGSPTPVAFPDPPPNHTVSDFKPEPVREPKPLPSGALNPPKGDPRRIGG